MKRLALYLIPLLFLTAACGSEEDPLTQGQPDQATLQTSQRYGSVDGRNLNAYPEDQREDIMKASMKATLDVQHIIRSAESPEEADRQATAHLETLTNSLVRSYAAENVALEMLRRWPEASNETAAERTGRHVNVLLSQNSPEVAQVASALRHLEGRWSPEKRRQAAAQALSNYEMCERCTASMTDDSAPDAAKALAEEAEARQTSEDAQALSYLRDLAGPSEAEV